MPYHINPKTGNPGVCRAKKSCPFGDLQKDHYASKDAAREAYEYQYNNAWSLQSETNGLTLASYDKKVQEYIAGSPQEVTGKMKEFLDTAFANVAPMETITELGAAFGRDTLYLQSQGHSVLATDAAQGFVDELHRRGIPARKLDITQDMVPASGGVLANAVFLHLTKDEAEKGFARVNESLVPGGVFAFTLKEGEGEEWSDEKLNSPRYFKYWKEDELRVSLRRAGFKEVEITKDDKGPVTWLQAVATKEDSYRGSHQPATDGAQGHDVESHFPDIYEHPEYYDFPDPAYRESLNLIKNMKDNPDYELTVYRAVPEASYGIEDGNWVSISKRYAQDHAMISEDASEDWPVAELKVKAKDIRNPGDSVCEWGYFPSTA